MRHIRRARDRTLPHDGGAHALFLLGRVPQKVCRMSRLEEQVRADIVDAGRRLYARAYIASNDGNISARLDDHRLMTTPKSVSKGFMTPDMMVIVDNEGTKLSGDRDPSTELPMH